MAGFATKDPREKEVLNIMRIIDGQSYGSSTESVRRLLETILEKQRAAIMRAGTASSVGWVEEVEKNGLIIGL
jgi:hypothetical protein